MMKNSIYIVQLPFPSMLDPHPRLRDYYSDYGKKFLSSFPEFFVPEGSLWELPVWVAHLAGMLEAIQCHPEFLDLSYTTPDFDSCIAPLLRETSLGDLLLFSPLAQNFDLTVQLSKHLQKEGRRTILGGNMTPVAQLGDASVVYHGQVTPGILAAIIQAKEKETTATTYRQAIRQPSRISWVPSYRLLTKYRGRVPLLRLNASHGCLFSCSFCGDAWTRQLRVVEPFALEVEVMQFEEIFPDTHLIYIGDKTFGQSREAIMNLLKVFENRHGYRFIIQTHVLYVTAELIEVMRRLGVVAVELGFETADVNLLKQSKKVSKGTLHYLDAIQRIASAEISVILNILGGLPMEQGESHEKTVQFIKETVPYVWLFNLYNFVPYPLTPYFPLLRSRIYSWEFCNWREDAPSVFHPYYQTVEESWNRFLEKVEVAHAAILAA
jgi:hypothetical protein